jgi:hypothetical protein
MGHYPAGGGEEDHLCGGGPAACISRSSRSASTLPGHHGDREGPRRHHLRMKSFSGTVARGPPETDPETAQQVRDNAFRWSDLVVRAMPYRPSANLDRLQHEPQTLLDILSERARARVKLVSAARSRTSRACRHDLVVASDESAVACASGRGHFGTRVVRDRNKYIWLGTSKVRFVTFPPSSTPSRADLGARLRLRFQHSTFIVETSPTPGGAQLRRSSPMRHEAPEGIEASLDSHTLSPKRARGLTLAGVPDGHEPDWHHGNLALMVMRPTPPFTIGSARGWLWRTRSACDASRAPTSPGALGVRRARSDDLIEAQRTAQQRPLVRERPPLPPLGPRAGRADEPTALVLSAPDAAGFVPLADPAGSRAPP